MSPRNWITEIKRAAEAVPIFDLHTHLFPSAFRARYSAGLDDLLTYHYLTSEYLSLTKENPSRFFSSPKSFQAELVWKALFVERTPLSEAARGVLTVLTALGVKWRGDYGRLRRSYPNPAEKGFSEKIFKLSGVNTVVMTNNPFDAQEWSLFRQNDWDRSRFLAALRLDDLFFTAAERRATAPGVLSAQLEKYRAESDARYVALSPSYAQLFALASDPLMTQALLPYLESAGLPLALMIGPRRALQPAFGAGGDGISAGSLDPLEKLLIEHSRNSFLVTTLDQGSHHRLLSLARIFPHLRIFGFWWYMNNPTLVRDGLRLRFEMLGTNFIAQHSDARVLDQLIYKWAHFKTVFAEALGEQCRKVELAGVRLQPKIVQRDVDRMLRAQAQAICAPAAEAVR